MLPAATKIGGIMAKKQRKLGSSTAPLTGMWANMGSTIATLMFVWTVIRQYCPPVLRRSFENYARRLMGYFKSSIPIFGFPSASSNEIALGATVWWVSTKIVSQSRSSMSYYPEPEKRIYTITFHKKHRELITKSYLEHVLSKGKEIRVRNRGSSTQILLITSFSATGKPCGVIVFEHPATFESMAMEPEKKREIVEDLLTFSKSKDFYAKIGKAWKRGYLLYGPPGTGKSTMIAAMANLLNYDVYDLELTAVKDNTELRKLLIFFIQSFLIISHESQERR
ncbi:hypothetical protein FH972_019024 [Carpinus fangiana]|uniref:ATPase AAA-type core domain-containing protein n=1 Tax=Carpinus fangiana TaxID=176857 RepID=A0A5N6RT27_9ROSI|nr:hypothetical protein FH972_019024 [Carpinus fangiana]